VHFSVSDIEDITRAAIVHAIHKKTDAQLSCEQFVKWMTKCEASPQYKQRLFEFAERYPIPIFFAFAPCMNAPELKRNGFFNKSAGSFASRKKRFFVIEGYMLNYYKDKNKAQQVGEVELIGTVTEIEKGASKKIPDHLCIKRTDGKVFGCKVSKGTRKKGHHTEFVLFTQDIKTLDGWVIACNITAFLAALAERFGETP
jgi:hypothetical protein